VTPIVGWLTPEVGAAMRNLIWKVKPSVCVEIGVFAGKSLINTALALKENGRGIVYGIDPWRTEDALKGMADNESADYWRVIDLDAVHYDCMRAIWQHEVEEHAVIIRAKSRDALPLFEGTLLDILYIDGGHSEESSCQDVEWYLPCVRAGGHIWMDDVNYESLKKAVQLVERDCVLVKDFGHCRLYRKL
jgi:predicted O-methyltransferase YrrM